MTHDGFLNAEEQQLCDMFLEKGYVIVDVDDRERLDKIALETAKLAFPDQEVTQNQVSKLLSSYHTVGDMLDFNSRKMEVANKVNQYSWLRPSFYHLGKRSIDLLAGNQLAQQNKAILTVLMPEDSTSILPIHADAFSGETPYQINQWVPLVDVESTMSMFFLERKYSEIALQEVYENKYRSMSELFEAYEDKLEYLTVPYGKQIFFCSNFFHGNSKNQMSNTRWAFHVRYANILAPFRSPEKTLGNFYQVELLRPATKLGMEFDEIQKRSHKNKSADTEIDLSKSEGVEKTKQGEIDTLRTYVSPRKFGSWRLPVPMQNILLRDYCEKNGKIIKLPANELCIDDSYMVLNMTLDSLEEKQGIAMCSIEMLPSQREQRKALLLRGLNMGSEWHFIFENIVISKRSDIEKLDMLDNIASLKC